MNNFQERLTVYFEDPFWVGVFERIDGVNLSVCKVTFGAEPKDCDIFVFVLKHYYELKFSSSVKTVLKKVANNPKRNQRNAKKFLQISGIGTKSQQVLKMQYKENKTIRKQKSKEQKDMQKQVRFNLKQQKKKEKHKGH